MATRKETRSLWLERASQLPESPGVYLMKDAEGVVVYVGKAKSLRARVRQYFQEGTSDYRAFIGLLDGLLADLETVVTRTEKEALLVEREMIRRYEPRFNIIWRDDKQYLCLRVDTSHEFPWVQVVRHLGQDGAHYYGPFHSASAARKTLRVVNRHFQLRTCRDSVLYNRTRPCLEHQIGRCPAPCVLEIDRAKYKENVDDVLMFLDGKGEALADKVRSRMWGAAERTDYEVAAHYRDQLRAIEKTLEKQKVALNDHSDQDVFGLYREGDDLGVAIVEVRGGRVENVTSQLFEKVTLEDEAFLETVILQRYAGGPDQRGLPPPDVLLLPRPIEADQILAELLSEQRGKKVIVYHPQRGDRAELLRLAEENAEHGFHEQQKKTGALERTLTGLKEKLGLRRFPGRMECYDISNLQGSEIVGSQVVFEGALPAKDRYRHYRVKTTAGQDDFGALYEVLSRRLKRGLVDQDLPDLLVIDGGKGQLNAAKAAMKDLGVEGIDLISLAKSRTVGTDEADRPEHSPERVFLPGAKDPIVLRQTSAELLLLARIRDEAHRFAITYQRKLRQKARLASPLDEIPGIGPGKRRALLAHLGSLKRVKEAGLSELLGVPGLGQKAAEAVYLTFHPDAKEDDFSHGSG
ncbi:MAG: excinuclease ABC subunit UvrC [Deltaproteobacteria bacterium]|nr:excinuclease ABC subunit UvrC [Deltaproteobacteria bacterium]